MPIYEYECPGCGKQFEVAMGIADHDRLKEGGQSPVCPECGAGESRQVVSAFNCKAPSKY